MRVALVVPVVLPCAPRGYGRGRWRRGQAGLPRARGRRAATPATPAPLAGSSDVGRRAQPWRRRPSLRRGRASPSFTGSHAAPHAIGCRNVLPPLCPRSSRAAISTLIGIYSYIPRSRIVSRSRPFNNGCGYRAGYNSSRFGGSQAQFAIYCTGHRAMIFWAFLPSESMNMDNFRVSITTTTRRRKLSDGTIASYPQWYAEYRDP